MMPSQIAVSAAQAPLAQRQAARVADAAHNSAARSSQRLRQLTEQHNEAVEDFYETTDDPMVVKNRADADPDQRQNEQDPPPEPEHIDVTA